MTRRLLNLLTAVSLLAAVAVAAAWVRGHFAGDVVRYVTGGTSDADQTRWYLGNGGGGVALVASRGSASDVRPANGDPPGWNWRGTEPLYAAGRWGGDSTWNRAGFYFFDVDGNSYVGVADLHGVIVPAWSLFLLAAALPAARAVVKLRRRRDPGTCPRCGYDLRATPEKCPECGNDITTPRSV